METHAGDPRAFDRLDLDRLPSPCFVVDEVALETNLRTLADVANRSGATVLAALKAFSMWSVAPAVGTHLGGTCASGLWEARLGRREYGGTLTTYSPAFRADEIDEIIELSDHVVFNSPAQHRRFAANIEAARRRGSSVDVGLRINPEHSEAEVARYDPAAPGSRLGHPVSRLCADDLVGVDGLHVHSLCEQDLPPLLRTWAAVEPFIAPFTDGLRWINLGGGHHITRRDYDRDGLVDFVRALADSTGCEIHLEPGEAVALDAGILVAEVLDVIDVAENGEPIAILDVSATCHMPDVLEAPYRPALLGEAGDTTVRLGGPSCLAGDVIGDYSFVGPPEVGRRLAFLDQAHYSMVKTTTFNGVGLPAIALWNSDTDDLRIVKRFDYDDFKGRLS